MAIYWHLHAANYDQLQQGLPPRWRCKQLKSKQYSLLEEFGCQQMSQLPVAALTAITDQLDQNANWLRADPVAVQADLSTAYMMGNDFLNLSEQDFRHVSDKLASLLAEDGLKLHCPAARRWYIECPEQPLIRCTDPNGLLGKAINDYLPSGQESKIWMQRLTEWQMLLSQHPVIDWLWIWGNGKLPVQTSSSKITAIAGDCPIVSGLAKHCNVPSRHLESGGERAMLFASDYVSTDQFSEYLLNTLTNFKKHKIKKVFVVSCGKSTLALKYSLWCPKTSVNSTFF